MIDIKDVTWTYAGAEAPTLTEFTLRVPAGETVVLCGASGSGKSTALRLINGLIPHLYDGTLTGSVQVNGQSVPDTALDRLGRDSGTVLQHPRRQFFTDTVAEEVAFGLENAATEPAEIRRRVAEVTAEFALTSLSGRRLGELSAGQQQRVACAAALAHHPGLVLFDEPTANLAPDAVDHFTAGLRRLRERKATIVVVEHRLQLVRGIADRVLVMRDGTVEREWPGAEFALLDDNTLAAYGLRGTRPATARSLPVAPARGGSVARKHGSPSAAGTARRGLVLENIRCGRGDRPLLHIAHAELPAGVVTAVRGDNGAGKTTLARIVTGLQRHEGTVALHGTPLRRAQRQRVSTLVMQDVQRQLFADRVAAELTPPVPTRGGAPQVPLDTLLHTLGLADLRERHPLSLSGGQQQRLAVAVARLTGRPIVVFDEPSSGVDRRHLASITGVIRDLAREGAVVLLISHDQDLLNLAADIELTLARIDGDAPLKGRN